jgi:hypothetical protein
LPTPAPSISASSSTTASAKSSTLRDYDSIFRNHVLPHVGDIELDDLTADRVEYWAAHEIDPDHRLANRTREKTIVVFHGVIERARKR